MAETVVIEFVADTSGLQPAEDRLQEMGEIDRVTAERFKKTNDELRKRQQVIQNTASETARSAQVTDRQQAIYDKLAKSLDTLSGKSRQAVQELMKLPLSHIEADLDELGMSAEGFLKNLSAANQFSGQPLRKQLAEITKELQIMRDSGQEGSEAYELLTQRAAELQKNISDVGKEIKRTASDTQTLDTLIGSVQALAGGFAVVQGAVGLFGDKSEELQETLLRVNAVMAVMQGLQQVQNSLQKDGAATKAADLIVTRSQIAAQMLYATVVGNSTGAMKAFRIALASTGIGLLVIAVAALAANWDKVKESVSGVSKEMKDKLETAKESVKTANEEYDALEAQEDVLKLQGKSEREILNLKIASLETTIEANREQLEGQKTILQAQVDAEVRNKKILSGIITFLTLPLNILITTVNAALSLLDRDIKLPTVGEALSSFIFDPKEVEKEGQEAIKEAEKAIAELENRRAGYLLRIQKMDEDAAKDRLNKEREARLAALNDELAALERRKLQAEENSRELLEIEKKIITQKALIELENEKLTNNQRLLIREEALKDQEKLEKDYIERRKKQEIQAIIDTNNAELSQLNLSSDRRRQLEIANIQAKYELEIREAKGNAEKIKALEAQRDNEVAEKRKSAILEAAEYDIELTQSRSGAYRRSLEEIANDEKKSTDKRKVAIEGLVAYELNAIQRRKDALETVYQEGLIAEEDYIQQIEKLTDDELKIREEKEEKITDLIKEENKKRLENAIEVAGISVDTLSMIWDNEAQKRNNELQAQRTQIDELLEAGAITEKEAERRRKRLEQQERQAKMQEARRDKAIAVFQSLLAIPQAFLRGLSQGGPILAGIYAAAAGVQAGLIAARPIPKFGRGKKNTYEGFAEVGETGPEILERNGKSYLIDQPSVMWVGKFDKIFNPEETRARIPDVTATFDKSIMTPVHHETKIDYDKFGKAVAKNINLPNMGVNIDENGISTWVNKRNAFIRYLDKRRGF